jgi:hypothetical protein
VLLAAGMHPMLNHHTAVQFKKRNRATRIRNIIAKWQQQWDNTDKGLITKEFFPNIKTRLKMQLKLTPNFTTIVAAHGKTKACLHRFKITQSPECICTRGEQTTDRLLFDCELLDKERAKLIAYIHFRRR